MSKFAYRLICLIREISLMNTKGNYKRKPYLKDEIFLREFGNQIREVRRSKNITQEVLANTINVDISQISRLERGVLNASVSLVKDISVALDMELKTIFEFEYTQRLTDS
ncbi:MAG: helix-turn-helix transcriptional regulator [Flavobacteriaceae bacterium]|nr:helix-turn-helix transcriptional regulator [Flavobacteriaceae bacterium]